MRTIYTCLIAFIVLTLALPLQSEAKPNKKGEQTFTIVIDAGHGGKDTGAIDNNVKEKDINLGVAKELAEKIRKEMKDVKVVMTRDNDSFISLQGRADKANSAKGNLFISIHTNSVDKNNKNRSSVAGASVYALGLHKDANNMSVARRENSVISLEKNFEEKYQGFDPNSDESYIIFEMAQKKNLSQSIKFAEEVEKQLVTNAGRKSRGVHQAGFWVLWATSMPAVLVELDFICNPNSAKFMGSSTGQKKLANAIFNAVKKYRASFKGKNNSKHTAEREISHSSSDNQEVVLASARSESRIVSPAPEETPKPGAYAAARRRRRSNASRESSSRKDFETESITVKTYHYQKPSVSEEADNKTVTEKKQAEDNSKTKKSKDKKKDHDKKKKENRKDSENKITTTTRRIYKNKVVVTENESQNSSNKSQAKNNSKNSSDKKVSADSGWSSRVGRDADGKKKTDDKAKAQEKKLKKEKEKQEKKNKKNKKRNKVDSDQEIKDSNKTITATSDLDSRLNSKSLHSRRNKK